jgi:uncharacterized protein DUF4232
MTMHESKARRVFAGVASTAMLGGLLIATSGAASAAQPCKASDLTTSLSRVDAGAGQRYTSIDFTNRSDKTCVLRNDLTNFLFEDAKGKDLPTDARLTGDRAAVELAPGQVAHLDLHWTVVGEGPGFTPSSLSFTMPAGNGRSGVVWSNAGEVNSRGVIDIGDLHR